MKIENVCLTTFSIIIYFISMMDLTYTDSIQECFNSLCTHHLTLYANETQVLTVRKKYNNKQAKTLRKYLYHTLYTSLYAPYILTNQMPQMNWNNKDNNVYSGLAEEVFKIQLTGNEEDGTKLTIFSNKAKELHNETVDKVIELLLLLSNRACIDSVVSSKRLVYKKLEENDNDFNCFQFDSKVMNIEIDGNEHFGRLLEDDPLFTTCHSQLFDETPGFFCNQNSTPYFKQKSEESLYSKQTRSSLFGGLAASHSTSMDIALNVPNLPGLPRRRELEYGLENESLTDEGFDEPSLFSVTTASVLTETSSTLTDEINENMMLWDTALKLGKVKTLTWEKEESYDEKFNNLYLTELGDHAFDCMYTRKLSEIERITGKMIDANMCTISQIYKDSLNALVGIPSQTYTFYPTSCSLKPKSNIRCSGLSLESLHGVMTKFAQVGTHYRQLNKFSQHHSDKPLVGLSGGFILKSFIDALKEILYSYWSAVFIAEGVDGLTLMELWGVFSIFARQLKFLADLCLCSEAFKRTTRNVPKPKFPLGANLLSYLYSLSIKNSSTEHYPILLYLFKSAANPFIRLHAFHPAGWNASSLYAQSFVTDWIFDGVSYDPYNEFFVHMDQHYLCFRDKHFWTEGFRMKQSKEAIPLFLDDLADNIFACGKAINLLKLTNIKHYLFERGFTQPNITVTFSSHKLESVEQRCQRYVAEVEQAKVRHERQKAKLKLEEEEEWRNKLKEEKQKTHDAIKKIEDLEREVKKAIQAKKQDTYEELKSQFEQAVLERKKLRERKLLDDHHWLDEMRKHDEKDDNLKKQARDELVAFYETLSQQAEEREFRANWIILRHEISDKRTQFLQNEEAKIQAEFRKQKEKENDKSSLNEGSSIKNEDTSYDSTDAVQANDKLFSSSELPSEVTPQPSLSALIKDFTVHEEEVDNVKHEETNENKLDIALQELSHSTVHSSHHHDDRAKHILYPSDSESMSSAYSQQFKHPTGEVTKRKILGNSALEGDTAKQMLYSTASPVTNTDPNIDLTTVEGAETKSLLYPSNTPAATSDKECIDLNSIEGAETKNLIYPKNNSSNSSSNVAVDLSTVEGAETKSLLYPSCDMVEQLTANVNMSIVEGVETKNLLYPTETSITVSDVKMNSGIVEGSETKQILYPTNDNSYEPIQQTKKIYVEGSETKSLIYPTQNIINDKESKGTSETMQVEGKETKQMLYPDLHPSKLTGIPYTSSRGSKLEGDAAKNLLYLQDDSNTTTNHHLTRQFEKPSLIQDLLYPSVAASEQNVELKRVSRGFEPATTITKLLYPKENKKDSDKYELKEFSLNEVWMDSVVEPFQDDFSAMDLDPQPYLFGNTNNSITEHFDQSEPETDANIIKQLPLETIIKRSLTAPILAQVTLVNSAVIQYFLNDLSIEVHFDAFRKFLLLEDGEFGHSLCSQLFEKISSGMKPQDLCNTIRLNNIIIEALRLSLYASRIKYSSQLTFELKWLPEVFQPSDVGALDFLELRYRVPWPCNIIVTENSITKYNKVFSFLLKLKKAGWNLQEVWVNLKKAGHDKKAAMSPQLRQLQLYRHEMQHFVNNLERYIVNQIIHVSWREFQQDLSTKVHSLDDLHKCHVNYLNKIIFRSLLSKNAAPVYKLINDIFGMIAKFEARLLTTSWKRDVTTGYVTHPLFSKLKAVHGAFKQCGEFLFSVISKLVRRGYQDHLDDLLLQVNFNAYYTTAVVKK